LSFVLRSLAYPLFIVAAALFWAGGRAIHEFLGTERTLGELEGLGLAALFAAAGAIAKHVAYLNDEDEQPEPDSRVRQ
jgi:hypothetical protein